MSKKPTTSDSLAALRAEIDHIDEAMHNLLMQRGEIIDRLIAVKQTQETGSAFRPAREAEMMRRLVDRHHGILPLDTAESIWRVIISTFTFVQAPFSIHADLTDNAAAMRDSVRFHFGFTVPCVAHMAAAGVVAAVSESRGDLGLVQAHGSRGAWWTALEFDSAPKIIARLPFVDREDHPAGLPVFVISRVAPETMVPEVQVFSLRVAGWGPKAAKAVASMVELIAVPDSAFDGAALLVSVPQGDSIERICETIVKAGGSIRSSALVGSHATRYTPPAAGARPK